MSSDIHPATIDVTVRIQTAHEPDVDVALGVHERTEGLRVARYLAAFYSGHIQAMSGDEETTSTVVTVVPPRQTAFDPRTAERLQRIAAIRETLLVTDPGTEEYDSLTHELFHSQPVAHRPPPRHASTEQQATNNNTSTP